MNLETFYEQFELLADAPKAVQMLREMILQLAMSGKLVKQDRTEQSARSLLDKITECKNSLVTQKAIRKPLSLPEIDKASWPFELPETWVWTRLGEVFDVRDGTHDTPKYIKEGVPLVTSKNIYGGQLDLSNVKYISHGDHKKISERSKVDRRDILFAMIGSIGNPVIVDTEEEFSIKNVALFKYFSPVLSEPRYLHCYLLNCAALMRQESSGAVQSFVSLGFLRKYLFALPPLEEQKRIVAKVDELMALCDDLETQQQARAKARSRLNTVALGRLSSATDEASFKQAWARVGSAFNTFYSTPETITELRKTILQLAVQGKLVRQGVSLTPREIPLEELLREPSRNGLSPKPSDVPPGTPILRISAATSRNDAVIDETDYRFLEVQKADLERYQLNKGDLLACRFNGNLHYVGKFAIYKNTSNETRLYPDKLIRFRLDTSKALPEFVCLTMNSPLGRAKIEAFCATTAGNIGISAANLKTVPMKLPDVPTQKRIVAKVDELMTLVDELEAGLLQARGDSERLLGAVIQSLLSAENMQPLEV